MPTTKPAPRIRKSATSQETTTATRGARKGAVGPRKASPRKAGTRVAGTRGPVAHAAAAEGEPVTFEPSSGNVFADMGLPDAEERLAKAELARIVRGIVRERKSAEGWTQARAARALGIAAADMSNLMRGKLAGFSQERLEHFLTRLGMDVRIQVAPRPAGKDHAEITVERVAAFA